MTGLVETKKTFELKKHVGAIHSNNRLTLVQRKIANALLYNAYENLLTCNEHCIHIKTLCDLIGYDSNDYKTIRKALVALISTVIQWNLVDKNRTESEEIWNASAIIADVSIDGPICKYSYSNRMRELLYHPEIFGRLNMRVQAKFKSTYGLALYENCIRYQNISQTPWFDMQTFRILMGVEEGKYTIFRDFKRRVLDKAIQEVNEYSPVALTVKEKRVGQKVVSLQFLITHKQKAIVSTKIENANSVTKGALGDRLKTDFGFSNEQIEKSIISFDEQYILEKIDLIESSSTFQTGKIVNLAKYLENALEKDYQPPKSSRERVIDNQQLKEKEAKNREIHLKRLEEYRRYQDKEILNIYHNKMQDHEQKEIVKDFEKYIKNTVYYNAYTKDGLSHLLVADRFCYFIKNNFKKIIDMIVSFEEFCHVNAATSEREGE